MQIQANTKYILANDEVISFKKNSLPYYCWSADVEENHYLHREVWSDEGKAYHHDCGFSVAAQYIPLENGFKIVSA